jgi:transcriptional regulator with XRE-family HTH domain
MVAMASSERVARQVGSALQRIREKRRCRRYQLAASAGISGPQLARYELGKDQPSAAALAALLSALDCSADEYGRHLGPWGILPA